METFLKQVVRIIAPDSLAFHEDDAHRRYTTKEFFYSEELKSLIQPGDLVITKTPSNIHAVMRRILGAQYDHIAAFMTKTQALHVSPPRIRTIISNQFLMEKLHPIILRPKFNSPQEREQFIQILRNAENEKYDYNSLLKLLGLKFVSRFYNLQARAENARLSSQEVSEESSQQAQEVSKKNICTDFIAYALAHTSPAFLDCIRRNYENLDIAQTGSFTPDDIYKLAQEEGSQYFKIVYPTAQRNSQRSLSVPKLQQSSKQSHHQIALEIQQQSDALKEGQSALTRTLAQKDAPLQVLQNRNVFLQDFKTRQKQLKDEVKIVVENNQDSVTVIGQVAAIVDKLLTLANKNRLFTNSVLGTVRYYSHSSDIYIQMARMAYYLFKLRRLTKDSQTIMKNKKEFLKCFGELLLCVNALITYYRLEDQAKRVWNPKL